jgi:hypothetical protein
VSENTELALLIELQSLARRLVEIEAQLQEIGGLVDAVAGQGMPPLIEVSDPPPVRERRVWRPRSRGRAIKDHEQCRRRAIAIRRSR